MGTGKTTNLCKTIEKYSKKAKKMKKCAKMKKPPLSKGGLLASGPGMPGPQLCGRHTVQGPPRKAASCDIKRQVLHLCEAVA